VSRQSGSKDQRQGSLDARPAKRRRRRVTENDEFGQFVRRIVRAYGVRVAAGDIEALAQLAGLSAEVDAAIRTGVAGLRRWGYSWSEIGARLKVTKQAAFQRWGGEQR
jgi:hypothetical protein